MALFRTKGQSRTLQSQAEPEPALEPPVEGPVEEQCEHSPAPPEDPDPLCIPLEQEPPDVSRQRGCISTDRAAALRLQVQVADHLRRAMLAPDVPLDLPLERTPERERALVQGVKQIVQSSTFRMPPGLSGEQFYQNVADEAFGYGPIQSLVDRDDISEIMVNGPYVIFVERKGRLVESGFKFLDDDHVERTIKRIVLPLGRAVGPDAPLVDARLPDGSRVNAVVRPCAIDGPNITIRKFSRDKLQVADLLRFGSLSEDMARFLEAAVVSRRNIVVSGGTGSGKTTLINILSDYIPEHERTVTIEDAAELQLRQRNVVRLETKKPSPHSPHEVTIRDCVVNALRMRPERIVVGECRSGEALDMLQAMNTGHDGSMTTVHSNSPRDCISRLETLVLMAGVDFPVLTVRKQIASAIHLIVQASRLRDGSRRVTHVTEVLGMEGENVTMQDLYRFFDQGDNADAKVTGYHGPVGIRPYCDGILKQYGFNLPGSMFIKKPR